MKRFTPIAIIAGFALGLLAIYVHLAGPHPFYQLLGIKPELPMACVRKATEYKKIGMTDKAILAYQKCLRKHPGFDLPHSLLGDIYYDRGLLDKAETEYHIFLKTNPYSEDTHYHLGLIYFKQNKFTESIEMFNEALHNSPSDQAMPHFYLSKAYENRKMPQEAHSEIEKYKALKDQPAAAHFRADTASRTSTASAPSDLMMP